MFLLSSKLSLLLTTLAAVTNTLVTANHSTCSWKPFNGQGDPKSSGWHLWCTAYPDSGHSYNCDAAIVDNIAAKVADYGKLAPGVLELGKCLERTI